MNALRADLQAIAEMIPAQSKVLDIGCGEGMLLAWLTEHKHVDARGIEIDQPSVQKALSQGLSVIQGDVNCDLSYYPDDAYDYVVLSQALQALNAPSDVLDELLRISKNVIVSVPNFGHWRNRFHLAFKGRMPVTKQLIYAWYDTPNIHFCTITDFVELCESKHITIQDRIFMNQQGTKVHFRGKGKLANLIGQQGIFLIHRS